jgi:hypothetical protein
MNGFSRMRGGEGDKYKCINGGGGVSVFVWTDWYGDQPSRWVSGHENCCIFLHAMKIDG